MAIRILEHRPGEDLDAFLRVPELLYKGDPGFVMPLYMEQRDRLTPSKNPFFQHAEATYFTANTWPATPMAAASMGSSTRSTTTASAKR